MSTAVPANDPYLYNPDTIGTRPAYAFYLHDVSGIHFRSSSSRLQASEARPPFLVNHATDVDFDRVTAQSGWADQLDIDLQAVSGIHLSDSYNTSGHALRVNTSCELLGDSLAC